MSNSCITCDATGYIPPYTAPEGPCVVCANPHPGAVAICDEEGCEVLVPVCESGVTRRYKRNDAAIEWFCKEHE